MTPICRLFGSVLAVVVRITDGRRRGEAQMDKNGQDMHQLPPEIPCSVHGGGGPVADDGRIQR